MWCVRTLQLFSIGIGNHIENPHGEMINQQPHTLGTFALVPRNSVLEMDTRGL